jgi:hypothetical protein
MTGLLGWGCVSLVSPGREIGVVKEAVGGCGGVGVAAYMYMQMQSPGRSVV